MEIGEPQRRIAVEPLVEPVPAEAPEPEPVEPREPEPAHAE